MHQEPDRTVMVLGDLARLAAGYGDQSLPLRLVRACVVILGVDGAAITLANTRPERITLCSTDSVAARLEDLQEVMGQGPSTQAYDRGETVTLALDGLGDDPWPRFASAALEQLGVLSISAVPIRPGTVVLGVLTLFSRGGREPLHSDETTQHLVNAVGMALIDDADARASGTDPVEDTPWSSRDLIHQATGMVIAQLGVSASDALALLRAHAYAHDRSMLEISEEIVQRRLDLSETDLGEESPG